MREHSDTHSKYVTINVAKAVLMVFLCVWNATHYFIIMME